MLALNFQSPHHEELLEKRIKNCTVRLGDVREVYRQSSVVWVTFGKKFEPKKKLYQAFLDKVVVKEICQLTSEDLVHQNPGITSYQDLIGFFEKLYGKAISPDDTVSVIYFSEIVE